MLAGCHVRGSVLSVLPEHVMYAGMSYQHVHAYIDSFVM